MRALRDEAKRSVAQRRPTKRRAPKANKRGGSEATLSLLSRAPQRILGLVLGEDDVDSPDRGLVDEADA